jgi:hypothetical protein
MNRTVSVKLLLIFLILLSENLEDETDRKTDGQVFTLSDSAAGVDRTSGS